MSNSVYLSWQDPVSRLWFVVGRLSQVDEGYEFAYTEGATKSSNFILFPGMEALDKKYFSPNLFPLFANRLLSKNRKEYKEFIDWLELPVDQRSPLDILSRSGGARATDSFQVFRQVKVSENSCFSTVFFLHGLSHVGKNAADRVLALEEGEELRLGLDIQNPVDINSVMVLAKPTEVIGFLPRYLAKDIGTLLQHDPQSLRATVVARHDHAPRHYRLLCRLEGKVPDALQGKVFNSNEFSVIE